MARFLPLVALVLSIALAGCPRSRGRGGVGGGGGDDAGPGPGTDSGPCVPTTEICNAADDDCDGLVDEGDVCGSVTCEPGETACGPDCVDTRLDPAHCGECGTACGPTEACVDGACCDPTPTPIIKVDLLFLIDNSNSMTEEQASFAVQIPRLVRALTTGDRDGDGAPDFAPVTDVNFGVITTDMGVGGLTIPTCADGDFGDDGILRTEGNTSIPGCAATYPSFLTFRPGGDSAAVAEDLACVARMGTGGCGFEQHLEAVLKAVTPSTSHIDFVMGTPGHGDGANAGFVRPDALLAVVLLTDEEDCSTSDPELYNPSSSIYTGDLNLRCFSYPTTLQKVERYVDGLLDLKSHPSHVVFDVIAGVPLDLAGATYEEILADDRMQELVDPGSPTRLIPSCNVPGRGLAFPPRRLVQVAQGLRDAGATTAVSSVCQEDFTSAVDAVIDGLATAEPLVCGR